MVGRLGEGWQWAARGRRQIFLYFHFLSLGLMSLPVWSFWVQNWTAWLWATPPMPTLSLSQRSHELVALVSVQTSWAARCLRTPCRGAWHPVLMTIADGKSRRIPSKAVLCQLRRVRVEKESVFINLYPFRKWRCNKTLLKSFHVIFFLHYIFIQLHFILSCDK